MAGMCFNTASYFDGGGFSLGVAVFIRADLSIHLYSLPMNGAFRNHLWFCVCVQDTDKLQQHSV